MLRTRRELRSKPGHAFLGSPPVSLYGRISLPEPPHRKDAFGGELAENTHHLPPIYPQAFPPLQHRTRTILLGEHCLYLLEAVGILSNMQLHECQVRLGRYPLVAGPRYQ